MDVAGEIAYGLTPLRMTGVHLMIPWTLRSIRPSSSLLTDRSLDTFPCRVSLRSIITKKVEGMTSAAAAKDPFKEGTLGPSLIQTAAAVSLVAQAVGSLTQDEAIEVARIAVIHGPNATTLKQVETAPSSGRQPRRLRASPTPPHRRTPPMSAEPNCDRRRRSGIGRSVEMLEAWERIALAVAVGSF